MSKTEKASSKAGADVAATTAQKERSPHLREFQFQKGASGNPNGRPKGSRNVLSEAFITALHTDFATHGVKVIETVRAEKPAEYLKIVASLVPKDINLNPASLEDLSDEELIDALDQIRTVAALLTAKPARRH